jgi:hypothetical protein
MAYDNLRRPFLICADYEKQLRKMFVDTNTDLGQEINEYYTSPLVSPHRGTIKKGETVNFTIVPTSKAKLVVHDKVDYRAAWQRRSTLPCHAPRDRFLTNSFSLGRALLGSEKNLLHEVLAINATFNTYQFKIASDTPRAKAWEITDMSVNQRALAFGKQEPQR